MPAVPTYLRWIAAVTTGLMTQFAFFMIVGAVAIGTNNKALGGGVGLLCHSDNCRTDSACCSSMVRPAGST